MSKTTDTATDVAVISAYLVDRFKNDLPPKIFLQMLTFAIDLIRDTFSILQVQE
jgi:hypothetical protein